MKLARTKSTGAFTRTELVVAIACLVLLAAIFLPALAKSKAQASRVNCSNCLKNIGLAFRVWATDNNDLFPMQVSTNNGGTRELISSGMVFPHFLAMSNELSTPKILICPNDKSITEASQFMSDLTDTKISYFLNVDAFEEAPTGVLCGDRNLSNKASTDSRFINVTNTSTIGWTKETHSEKGYLVFADASVWRVANGSTGTVLKIPEGVTNRLAIP